MQVLMNILGVIASIFLIALLFMGFWIFITWVGGKVEGDKQPKIDKQVISGMLSMLLLCAITVAVCCDGKNMPKCENPDICSVERDYNNY